MTEALSDFMREKFVEARKWSRFWFYMWAITWVLWIIELWRTHPCHP